MEHELAQLGLNRNYMKTLRYNQTTQTFTTHEGQYKDADGKPGRIDPPVVQLEVIETTKPVPTATQKLLPVEYTIAVNDEPHNLTGINGTATEVWTVIDKTATEIAREQWHHVTNYRIKLPTMLLYAQAPEGLPSFSVVGLHMMIRQLSMVEEGEYIYLYCTEIDPSHQALVDALQGLITIEEYPNETT
jgi:hypothetical protein